VRQLKGLFPKMGNERMAQILGRTGLCLSATTIRRIGRERDLPPEPEEDTVSRRRRRVVARYPGHTWHIDLTAVPTRAGFWVPWFPFSLPQRWPFCWWVAVAVDQMSHAFVGFAVFSRLPSSEQVQGFLDRAIRKNGQSPRYVVTDKGKQFWCRGFKRWCKRRSIRPRYGALGQPASIAIAERFIRSMKQECLRCLLIPTSLQAMRHEVGLYATWYNTRRPHMTLRGKTPCEAYDGRRVRRRRFEPRPKWPHRIRRRRAGGDKLHLPVSYVGGRKHLPVIELRRVA
jgi:putative transposase